MKTKASLFTLFFLLGFFHFIFAQKNNYKSLESGIYAEIKTSKGIILAQLEFEKTPKTVANFVALAEGKVANQASEQGKSFYNGNQFHKIDKNLIQGGLAENVPNNINKNELGYAFDHEFNQELKHDVPGILSMASHGFATNGCEFLITKTPLKKLDLRNTAFGHVVQGLDVVQKIEQGDKIESIQIIRIGKKAKKFKAKEILENEVQSGLFAEINTSKGKILIRLEFEKTPMTVANFVGLAEGKISNNAAPDGTPYYDGNKFHRVIANFMIQGGAPSSVPGNKGYKPLGYKFADEFHNDLRHDGSGVLSMANAGPKTNSSQFFITHRATSWLDGKHSVFGRLVSGQKVVNAIQQNDKINSIKIIRKGEKAQNFDAKAVFEELNK